MKNRSAKTGTIMITLMAALLASPKLRAADEDSPQVSRMLSEAKTQAFQLSEDAAEMDLMARNGLSWQTQVNAVERIKQDINAIGKQLIRLQEIRGAAAPWQRTAIERISPLLKELAINTETVIERLNKNPNRLRAAEYKEYLEANADTANHLASLIADFVDYGKTKRRLEVLTDKLEL